LAGGGVLVLVMLLIWAGRLNPGAAGAGDGGAVTPPDPDYGATPGAALGVPFANERCVPWHVSASQQPPPAETPFVILSSRLADPYNLVASGFASECGEHQRLLVVENLPEDALAKALAAKPPRALVVAGAPALDLARRKAPDLPVLFALIPNPVEVGLDRSGTAGAGVSPWIPVEPAVGRLLQVFPGSLKTVWLLYPPGPMKPLAESAAGMVRRLGREARLLQLDREALDDQLAQASSPGSAWIVFPDRAGPDGTGIDEQGFNRIQLAAEKARIPIGVPDEEHLRAGALVGVGPDTFRIGAQLCRLAGALLRDQLPEGGHVFCPEYSFAAIHNTLLEKLGYNPDPAAFRQAKLYKWH
jgi:hypothetical protein